MPKKSETEKQKAITFKRGEEYAMYMDTEIQSIEKDKNVAKKYDNDKPALALIPHEAIFEIGRAMSFGAKKYGDHNWRGGFQWLRLASACNRHIWAWIGGEDKDLESGLSHLAHAGACLCILIAHEKSKLGEDDRWEK